MSRFFVSTVVLIATVSLASAQDAPIVLDDCQSLEASQKSWEFDGITPQLSADHATGGQYGLKLTIGDKGGAMSRSFKETARDWSHYKSLSFDVFNPEDQMVNIVIRIDDESAKNYKDRYERSDALFLPPGKMTHVDIDLTCLLANNCRLMDVSRIVLLNVHCGGPHVLYVDSFQFQPLPQKDWPQPVASAGVPLNLDDFSDPAKTAALWKPSSAKFEVVERGEAAGTGRALAMELGKDNTLKLQLTGPLGDWRPYRTLSISVDNVPDVDLNANVYIDDANTFSPDNRFSVFDIKLPRHQTKDINVDITRMVSRCGLKMDMSRIVSLKFDVSAGDQPATGTLFLSSVRLLPQESGVRNEVRPGRIPGQTPATLAQALLDDPEIKPLLPAFKAMGKKRFAMCSHSASMSIHWSTSGGLFDIAAEVVKSQDPDFEYRSREFSDGGMGADRAVTKFLKAMEDYHPTDAYFLVVPDFDRLHAEKLLVDGMKSVGARVFIFDAVKAWSPFTPKQAEEMRTFCRDNSATFIELMARGWGAPGSNDWCNPADTIHMETPGHVFYAKELLKEWAKIYAQPAPK